MGKISSKHSKHSKFIRYLRAKYKDCVPPIIISGHQFTIASHHQDAARGYLEAYKLLPENPLINLCVGTFLPTPVLLIASLYKSLNQLDSLSVIFLAGSALINLALGFRLQNKHQCLTQGLAFLYNNLRICENSQVCFSSHRFLGCFYFYFYYIYCIWSQTNTYFSAFIDSQIRNFVHLLCCLFGIINFHLFFNPSYFLINMV